jgi:hypothetical protein
MSMPAARKRAADSSYSAPLGIATVSVTFELRSRTWSKV